MRKADNHSVPLPLNVGTLTSWNPLGHSRSVKGLLYFLYIHITQQMISNRELGTSEQTAQGNKNVGSPAVSLEGC